MNVENTLKDLRIKKTRFIQNPGNAGDSLIASGTFQTLSRLGIQVHFDDRTREEDDAVLVSGGGGWHGYGHVAAIVKSLLDNQEQRPILILPSTVSGHAELLNSLPRNVYFFARDEISHQYLLRETQCHTFLDHDMAFRLNEQDLKKLLRNPIFSFPIQTPLKCGSILKRYLEVTRFGGSRFTLGKTKLKQNLLTVSRMDREKHCDSLIADDAIDLSETYFPPNMKPHTSFFVSSCLLNTLAKFDLVRTDRLHICIGAALMGISVEFWPNNYFKNEAVYKHSICEQFDHVSWMG